MNEVMPQHCINDLLLLAYGSPGREICGFILKNWIALEIENVSKNDLEFYMQEDQLLHAMMNYRPDIIGVYHSHPGGIDRPSTKDVAYAPKDMRYWIIANGDVKEWVIKDGDAYPVEINPEVVA